MADVNSLLSAVSSNQSDDYFRGQGFGNGRQGAIDYLAQQREQQGGLTANEKIEFQRNKYLESVKPAVDSLEQSVPEIGARYGTERTRLEGEKNPLKERYDNIINSIKGKETQVVNKTTTDTRNELGKRGVSLQSGLAQDEISGMVNPIISEYTGLAKDTELSKEAGLKAINDLISKLTGDETTAVRDVRNTIAQILAGAGTSAVNAGNQNWQSSLQMALQDRQLTEQSKQSEAERAFQDLIYKTIQLPESQYAVGKPYYKETTGSDTSPDLYKQFNSTSQWKVVG